VFEHVVPLIAHRLDFPLWEIKAVRDQWNDVLEHGPIDKDGKRYGMPIERAKEEILKQGLPARSQTADSRKQ